MAKTCPSCDAPIADSERDQATPLRCPECGALVETADREPAEEAVSPAEPAARAQTRKCPHCRERIPIKATKCRYCRRWLDEDEDDWAPAGPEYEPCPRCGARGARRVVFTFWGSFYGPALFTHVRCPKCGRGYNGKTGRSNTLPAITCVSIPLLLILGIIGGVIALVVSLNR